MKKRVYLSILASMLFWVAFQGCAPTPTTTATTSAPTSWIKLDTIKAGKFDTGKMWTFDFPPKEYFKQEYNFAPSDDWFDNVRKSALRFATYCSASFVSGDGLIMTNHHCARESVTEVEKQGEDLHENGFMATTLEDERKVPGLFVDQLVLIKDVTADIQKAFDEGKTEDEKVKNRDAKKQELEAKYKKETGLEASVVTFFNGGKYSLYGYKRYNDIRLVFAPETQMGFFGGDPDNFTYPRYDLDCSFFRAYDENGKPLKTENFYKWSVNGAAEGEPVFVIGNPGRTNRLWTVSQLEYARDIQYPVTMLYLNGMVNVYAQLVAEAPVEKKAALEDQLFGMSNSQKAYNGILAGLRDEVLMQRKRDFEASFKNAILNNPQAAAQYGQLWTKISDNRLAMRKLSLQNSAYNLARFRPAQYFEIGKNLVEYARQMKLAEDKRDDKYKGEQLEKTKTALFPEKFDVSLSNKLVGLNIDMLSFMLGADHQIVKAFTNGAIGKVNANAVIENSQVTSKEKVANLVAQGPDAILGSKDPFITYALLAPERGKELSDQMKIYSDIDADLTQQLGRAIFEVYGTNIPPDATFTLRIADGVVKGYDYNGTTAPSYTTFYGMYDRYYANGKKFPWSLPKRWQNPPAEFNLSTPMDFVSTADIIGGNSGSPIINQKAEVVGLAFDGNIESLPGQFIFTTEANRTVGVHSAGILEAIQDLFKLKRLGEELKAGHIVAAPASAPEAPAPPAAPAQ
jgi:hypothetical protein